MNIEILETKLYTMLSSYAESLNSYDNRFFISTGIKHNDDVGYVINILLLKDNGAKHSKAATFLMVNADISSIRAIGDVYEKDKTNTMVEIIKSCRPIEIKEGEVNEWNIRITSW